MLGLYRKDETNSGMRRGSLAVDLTMQLESNTKLIGRPDIYRDIVI